MYVVVLSYDVTFRDSDEGRCFAGEGLRLIKGFTDPQAAADFVAMWNPVISLANKESICFPVQPANLELKAGLGFTLHDFDQDEENYRLEIRKLEVV